MTPEPLPAPPAGSPSRREVARFEVASRPGNERSAARRVLDALDSCGLDPRTGERLQTAVAEAVLNAMEHGHQYDAAKMVLVRVLCDDGQVMVAVTDSGAGPLPLPTVAPDLAAKVRGEQPARGWGLFLIRNMVDDLQVEQDGVHHTLSLSVRRMPSEQTGLTA